jgi:predicted MPP superfamily phosphohydrolase
LFISGILIMSKSNRFNNLNWITDGLWNLWCLCSLVGIWPRFIEPKLVYFCKKEITIPNLPVDLDGFRVVQISDLHFQSHVSDYFLNKIVRKANACNPDIVVFTGDLISHSRLEDRDRLKNFLNAFKARYGCFLSYGNHDYAQYITIGANGYFDISSKDSGSFIVEGMKKLFNKKVVTKGIADRVLDVGNHKELQDLIAETPFKALENETVHLSVGEATLNISALGDLWLGRCHPEKAFANYKKGSPGLVLTHNPDTISELRHYPGDLILAGHTHGGQVNLPFLRRRFLCQKNMEYIKGLFSIGGKWLYVNRGLGSHRPFRWFSPPEIALFTLKDGKNG